jgi:predicted RNA-binding Zn-ribbon protein involved in translation (DUF1610 family)
MSEYPIVLCLVCDEKGETHIMNRIGKDSQYFYYKCPICGNHSIVDRREIEIKEKEKEFKNKKE